MRNDELHEAKTRGMMLAQRIITKYGTKDVLEIAERACVRVIYERWHPVTVGECNAQAATVCVNLNAVKDRNCGEPQLSAQELTTVIIAHELGHFFDAKMNVAMRQTEKRHRKELHAIRETIAHGFAEHLLQLPYRIEDYEQLWRI